MPEIADPCHVCDSGKAEAVDQLLWCGETARYIAEVLEWPADKADAIKWHHLNGHVKHWTEKNYTIAMVQFSQEIQRIKRRELSKGSERQRPTVLDRCDKNFRWLIDSLNRVEGLYSNGKSTPANVLDGLKKLVEQDPGMVKRLQDRQKPINVESTLVREPNGE